jgi:hypothetical protein
MVDEDIFKQGLLHPDSMLRFDSGPEGIRLQIYGAEKEWVNKDRFLLRWRHLKDSHENPIGIDINESGWKLWNRNE